MRKNLSLLGLMCLVCIPVSLADEPDTIRLENVTRLEKEMGKIEVVTMETNLGVIELALFRDKAPVTVQNFLQYVNDGFYNDTIFHRVIKDFMIQGGGLTSDFAVKKTNEPIQNESKNGLKNDRGTIAMARTGVVDSATSQFFINLIDNKRLDHKSETAAEFGYAVFGKVIAGMDVVDKIASQKTGEKFLDPENKRGLYSDVPIESIIIKSMKLITQ